MCGIVGIVNWNKTPIDLDTLRAMTNAISHRGPDGEGIWINDNLNVGFGHRRLSIIDLSQNGAQPMHYLENRYSIVFNGEIYNYLELRKILINVGYFFRSDSDTEVLLALYDLKKANCVNDLDGMFAFAIWDEKEKVLFCARDRFGEKPLYYRFKNNCLIFASEIKALKVYDKTIAPDKNVLQKHLLTGERIPDNITCFSEIIQLDAATTILIKDGIQKTNKYWDINLSATIDFKDPNEAFSEFERILLQSIKRRLRSDVSYGSSLSGGIDSSSIVGFIKTIDARNFNTFSARFHGSKDEGKWISEVVNKYKLKNITVYPDPEFMIDELSQIIYHHEYPIASSSIYAQWCVMKLVNENKVKVLLDGQGADEYLGGYDELKYFAIWDLFRNHDFKEFLNERKLFNKHFGHNGSLGWMFLLDPILKFLGKKRPIFVNGYSFREQLKHYTKNNLGELLRYADRNSMAHGVEVRLPFLSHELVDFCFKIPSNLLYHNGKTKYILRESAKNVLPEKIYNRSDKIGFAPPQNEWMLNKKVINRIKTAENLLTDFGFIKGDNAFRNLVTAELILQFH